MKNTQTNFFSLQSCIAGAVLTIPLCFGHAAEPAETADSRPAVDPKALSIINRAMDFLAAAPQFSTTVEMWQDTEVDGKRLQFAKTVSLMLRRPDRFRLDIVADVPTRSFYYDGKKLTLKDLQRGFFASSEVPSSIDEVIQKVDTDLGVRFPMEDLLLSRPFGNGAEKAVSGRYLGKEKILGVLCHHVAFEGELLAWQAWVQEGPMPVLRKAVLHRINPVDFEQLTAIFTDWDVTTPLGDFVFEFEATPGAIEIEFVAAEVVDHTEETPGASAGE